MLSGIVKISRYPLAAHKGERDSGIARGRLDQHGPRFDLAHRLGGCNHRNADAILDRVEGIEEFALRQNIGLGAGSGR